MSSAMPTRTLIQLAICTVVWGSTWLVIKTQLGVVPASWSVSYRFIAAAAAMLLYCVITGRSLRIGVRGHLFAIVLALLQFCLNFNFVYRAEAHVTSGLVAVAFALLVVPNALLAWAVLGLRINAQFALGSLLGIGGVALLFLHEFGTITPGGSVALGLVLTLGGVLCASVANVMQATPVARTLPPHGMLATALLYGAVIDAAVAFAIDGPPVIETTVGYFAGFLYLGVFGSALAFNLYYDAIRTVGPAKAAYSSLIVPFVAMALSTAFEGYVWTATAATGVALAVAGLWVALKARA